MIRVLVTVSALVLGWHASAQDNSADDICVVRPDLCPTVRSDHLQHGRASSSQRRVRRVRPTDAGTRAKAQAARRKLRSARYGGRCRKPGTSFDVNTVDLPLCGSEASYAADEALNDNLLNPHEDPMPQFKKQASRSPASSIDFDAYIQANANHPAFSSRTMDRQNAFEDHSKPATLTIPNTDGTGGGIREDSSVETSAASQAAPASPGYGANH